MDLLDLRARRAYVGVLVLVARCDGALVREESAAVEAAMGRAMLRPKLREEIRNWFAQPPALETLLLDLPISARRLALRDAMVVASVDGEYHPEELELISALAAVAEVHQPELDSLFDWVNSGWNWMAQSRSILDISVAGDA